MYTLWRKTPYVFISLFIVVLSLFQTFLYIQYTPAESTFPFVHNSIADYYYYVSFIQQGMEGRLFVVPRYTTDEFTGQPGYLVFPCIGFVAWILGISAPVAYMGGRIILSTIFWICVMGLVGYVFKTFQQRILAVFFVCITTPVWYRKDGIFRMVGDFYSGIDPIMRISFLPHHMLANTFFILSLVFFHKASASNKLRWAVLGGICASLCGLSNPAILLILFSTFGIATLLNRSFTRNFKVTIIYSVCIVGTILFMYRVVSSPVFGNFIGWEQSQQYPIDVIQFFMMLGPLSIIAVVGIMVALKKRTVLWNLIVGWFLGPFIYIAFQRFLPISNARYVQAAPYVPTGLLAFLAAYTLFRLLTVRYRILVGAGFLLLFTFLAVPSFVASIQNQLLSFSHNKGSPYIFVPHDVVDVMLQLSHAGEPDDIVLAPDPLPLLIPAFSNKRVMYGYGSRGLEKQTQGYEFFGFMRGAESIGFLDRERVRFLIFERSRDPEITFLSTIGCNTIYQNTTYMLCERKQTAFSL